MAILNVGKDVENWNSTPKILLGMQTGAITLENSLAVSQEVKHTSTIWSNHSTPRFLSMRKECICPYKDLYLQMFTAAFVTENTENNPNVHHKMNVLKNTKISI